MSRINRRQFVRHAGAALGASVLPLSLQRALAAPAQGGTLGSIAHVVIFSQENRSFDHYFGSMKGVRGFGDDHPMLRQNSGNQSVFMQQDLVGAGLTHTPFHLDTSCVYDVAHDWSTQQTAYNKGRMDAWLIAKGPFTMGYYQRSDIPWHYALADAFTLCDHYFCSTRTSTDPNRLYLMSGTLDPQGRNGGPATSNSFGDLTWTTYPERLQAAGISWRMYQEQDNYDDNALAWFKQFKTAQPGSPLFENGMKRRTIADFRHDVMNDQLPAVSWIIAPEALSEHPRGQPNAGAHYVNQYLDALASNPAVWAKTVFILTYDENGGFFDHVSPPVPLPGTPDEFVNGESIGLGFRVPTIVCSPWSRGGWVASETFDHTSILQFLEKWTGVSEPNISAWRRQVCGDLTSCFDFKVSDTSRPVLPDTASLASASQGQCSTLLPLPAYSSTMPAQEAGQKPLRQAPVQLDCWLSSDLANEGKVWINWANKGSKSAPLQINANKHRVDGPWFYQADPGQSGKDYWHVVWYGGGYYDLEVHGPAQFMRRFRGYLNAFAVNGQPEPDVKLLTQGPGQPVTITFSNPGSKPVTLTVVDRIAAGGTVNWAVTLKGKETRTLSFTTTNDWYDLGVTVNGDSTFYQSLVGHVEGRDGLTRPKLKRWS
ncbi:MAG: phospholipase C, phosphocholine-specific [Aquabacterium sp.]|nr:phospholipase C, phosphocholine-specific [Aquabacterium sp.]